jgi:hypothetical protein
MRPELDHKARSTDDRQSYIALPAGGGGDRHTDPDITPRPDHNESRSNRQRNPFANSFKHAVESPEK